MGLEGRPALRRGQARQGATGKVFLKGEMEKAKGIAPPFGQQPGNGAHVVEEGGGLFLGLILNLGGNGLAAVVALIAQADLGQRRLQVAAAGGASGAMQLQPERQIHQVAQGAVGIKAVEGM